MKIVLKNIEKSFSDKKVLNNINMTIDEGSFTTLLGPSGCGKTTLLRIISGLESPDSGEIFFNDRLIFSKEQNINIPPEKRGLGFVFQDFALWPHMSVFENVAFGLRTAKKEKNLKEEVLMALKSVHLEGFENRYPHQLSGGQQQRVAFARAIVIKPECILFDEPLSALDALLREEMRVELKLLMNSLNITSIFVTHDQTEAMEMSDYITVMSGGIIEQIDTPEVIYNHPKTSFVAHFVGYSNWIDEKSMFRPENAYIEKNNGDMNIYNTKIISTQFSGDSYILRSQYKTNEWKIVAKEKLPVGQSIPLYVFEKDIIQF